MPTERYFLNASLEKEHTIFIKGTEFHHLAHVMRTKVNDKVEVLNGRGALAIAKVLELKKDHAKLYIEDIYCEQPKSSALILAQAIPKPNRLDYILEKGTELGADIFWLFPGQLSVKKELFPNQIERAQALVIAATKQCGRLFMPEIIMKPSLLKWLSLEGNQMYFGDVRQQAPLFIKQEQQLNQQAFVTGPESGLTDEEVAHLEKIGAKGVKLHDNILRTDTASIMALSLMSHWQMY